MRVGNTIPKNLLSFFPSAISNGGGIQRSQKVHKKSIQSNGCQFLHHHIKAELQISPLHCVSGTSCEVGTHPGLLALLASDVKTQEMLPIKPKGKLRRLCFIRVCWFGVDVKKVLIIWHHNLQQLWWHDQVLESPRRWFTAFCDWFPC